MRKIKLMIPLISLITLLPLTTSCDDVTGIKLGMICFHSTTSTYDKNFITAFNNACNEAGLIEGDEFNIKTDIPESNDCYTNAKEMAEDNYKFIFSDSYGHQEHMLQAAQEFSNVQFCSGTGDKAKFNCINYETGETIFNDQSNYHNAFAKIHQGRYLAGIVAGQKLKELKEAGKLKGSVPKIGYVGAFPYAEVISGYSSFYLGAKSICNDVIMTVTFTQSWYDFDKEKSNAESLIKEKCDLISQHADSMGAPNACETANIPNVSYNISNKEACPNTYLVASKINWEPYFKKVIDCLQNNKTIPADYCGDFNGGSIELCEYGDSVSEEAKKKVEEAKEGFKNGTLHVYDVSKFNIKKGNGSYEPMSDEDGIIKLTNNVKFHAVHDGYFDESNADEYRSSPYFNFEIEGITKNS